MIRVFEEARNERHCQGWAWYVRFSFAEMTGLVAGAAGAWLDRKRASQVLGASPSGLPQELVEAQQRVDANLTAMVRAIANRQYERARAHSDEERQAREHLRVLREKYGITD
jgi:hypothetical protein